MMKVRQYSTLVQMYKMLEKPNALLIMCFHCRYTTVTVLSVTQLIWGQPWHVMLLMSPRRIEPCQLKGRIPLTACAHTGHHDVTRHAQLAVQGNRNLEQNFQGSVQVKALVTMTEENIFLFVPNLIGESNDRVNERGPSARDRVRRTCNRGCQPDR